MNGKRFRRLLAETVINLLVILAVFRIVDPTFRQAVGIVLVLCAFSAAHRLLDEL